MSTEIIPCTALMLTRNNAAMIDQYLSSLSRLAAVIVADGFSTDDTVAKARKFSNVYITTQDCTSLDHDGRILDFAAVRNAALAHARHDWILVVDTGEILPEAFIDEVQRAVAGEPAVYWVDRIFTVDGERIDRCAGYPARQIRLFHRSCTKGYVKAVHERLALLPGIPQRFFTTALPEAMPPYDTLHRKYAYYRRLEYRRLGVLSWYRWLWFVGYRNLRSIVGLIMKTCWIRITPGGKCMPLRYELIYIQQLLRLIIGLCPPVARRRMVS